MTPKEIKGSKYDEWEIQDALRTILRAKEIQSDDKMMKLVEKEVNKQKQVLNSLKKGE